MARSTQKVGRASTNGRVGGSGQATCTVRLRTSASVPLTSAVRSCAGATLLAHDDCIGVQVCSAHCVDRVILRPAPPLTPCATFGHARKHRKTLIEQPLPDLTG